MRLTKLGQMVLVIIILAGGLSAQIKGNWGLTGEYDSNAYNDYYGGGTIIGTAFLDLSTDIDLKTANMFLGADYSGSYSAYLSYLSISQNDHLFKTILWRGIGKNGFIGAGATYGFQLNAADRSAYDTNNFKAIGEAKIYITEPILLKINGALGNYKYSNLAKYDFDQAIASGSVNYFLPTRTGAAVLSEYKAYDFNPLPADSQVPSNVIYQSLGGRVTQEIAGNIGLSLRYDDFRNKVTALSYYMPDTLLNEVNEYFDYSGGCAEAKLTVRLRSGSKVILWGNYTTRRFSQLNAYGLPASDTSSISTRQDLGSRRYDKETVLGWDYINPISSGSNKITVNAGIYYDNNSSNDQLYNYKKLLAYAGFNYNF